MRLELRLRPGCCVGVDHRRVVTHAHRRDRRRRRAGGRRCLAGPRAAGSPGSEPRRGGGAAGDGRYGRFQRAAAHDGRQIGLKLYGFKPDSPVAELGLQIGDLAVALNDIRVDTKEGGLAAYDALLTADELRLELVRGGEALQIVLTLE